MANHSDKEIEDAAAAIGLSGKTAKRLLKALDQKPAETRGHGALAEKTSMTLDL